MKWFKWDNGRQNSGYSKMALAISKYLKFDCYLIRIPRGIDVPPHRDPAVEGYEHHRINITLYKPCVDTGIFTVTGPSRSFLFGRGVYFRPDLYEHSMTPTDFIWSNRSMYILSIGWLRKQKENK